ncbi:glycoside hydrolase family 104 protein [Cyanobium sp. CH-040]|uniref:glycoside hydrolase family 24 protein n=1 Tax=Cyanobium sp. CH-040 TaxID=2823708 RepID=UPI0020CCC916|nr:glycoside hydrolase family 104 protein [Cyanobium sp. CH-040]
MPPLAVVHPGSAGSCSTIHSRLTTHRLFASTLLAIAVGSVVPMPRPATAVSRPRPLPVLPEAPRPVAARVADAGPYTITPARRALLDTIRYAEGTWKGGSPEGYRVLYGGGLFSGLERHPEITVQRRYTSAAAGAYQFLPSTWQAVSRQLRLRSFEPHNQDQAALHLVERRGALALFDRAGLTADVMARLAPEWASLPAHHGGSYYGQPVKTRQELLAFYRSALQRHQAAG